MKEIINLILSNLGLIVGAGGLVFWFLEKRKFNAEVDRIQESVKSDKIDNDVKLSKYYIELLDDLKVRYEEKYQSYKEMMDNRLVEYDKVMSDRIKIQQDEIKLLKTQIRSLKAHIKNQDIELRQKDKTIKMLEDENIRTK